MNVLTHRKQWLSIVLKRSSKRNNLKGSSDIQLVKRTAIIKWPDLRKILTGIKWAVVGGVATRAYMPERATLDIDILINPSDDKKARQKLKKAKFVFVQELSVGGSTWKMPDGTMIDIISFLVDWFSEAFEELQTDPQGLPVLSLPYLVLMKLQSGRTQDLADITRMLGLANEEECNKVRNVIKKYQPDAVEDLESFISLGRLEAG
jgi:hypothetical protein